MTDKMPGYGYLRLRLLQLSFLHAIFAYDRNSGGGSGPSYSGGDGPQIEPNRVWGRNQIVKPSPTGRGYGVLFDAPWPTAITASAPDDRLETITVKRGNIGLDASAD